MGYCDIVILGRWAQTICIHVYDFVLRPRDSSSSIEDCQMDSGITPSPFFYSARHSYARVFNRGTRGTRVLEVDVLEAQRHASSEGGGVITPLPHQMTGVHSGPKWGTRAT